MKKRVLALLLVSAMVVTSLIGCGNSDESKKDSAKTETTENSSDNKEETKKVVVATAGTGEPYSLMSDDGKWTGIDAEMWDEIEKRTGWEVEVKQAAFDAIWGELDTGRVCICSACGKWRSPKGFDSNGERKK